MSKQPIYLPRQPCRVLVVACAAMLVTISALHAQSAASPQAQAAVAKVPAYDVVSIKPNKTGSGRVSISVDDGKFNASNVSLKMMILGAWGLKDPQIVNLPKWGNSARFDVEAKVLDPDKKVFAALTPEQFQAMQQPILTDRFQLKFHHEKKVLPIYELLVIKGGPKFKQAPANIAGDTGVSINNGNLIATAVPLTSLADDLSNQVSRIVIDKTGLVGKYNFQLSWSPEDAGPPSPDTAAQPGIFTALQEQLGLKLQPGKAEIETFVIDHAEPPSEN